jgi:four helix bundle protein
MHNDDGRQKETKDKYRNDTMKLEKDNPIIVKSMNFAIRCVRLREYLIKERSEYVMSKQLFRSGTSIGANIREAIRGQSKSDFGAKMNIALKEASESEYWIELLKNTDYITESQSDNLLIDCVELIKMLTSIVKTTFESENNK